MRAAVSWYKNISKINKEEAFTHAHAVHRSYGRGTLPDLIETDAILSKNCLQILVYCTVKARNLAAIVLPDTILTVCHYPLRV